MESTAYKCELISRVIFKGSVTIIFIPFFSIDLLTWTI